MSCESRESILSILEAMRRTRRPQMLLRTARLGLQDYARARDLRRLLGLPEAPPPGPETVRALFALEAACERARCTPGDGAGGGWRAERHIEVLIALICEARLLAEAVVPAPAGGAAAPDGAARAGAAAGPQAWPGAA